MNEIKLVLLSCCAPCSAGALVQVIDGIRTKKPAFSNISDFIVLFYNPNIYPETEYQKRLDEQIKYCEQLGVKYHIGEYDHDKWLNAVGGMESEPERGSRCAQCFRFRFRFARDWAAKNGYNAIASVLGVSKHKDQTQVDTSATDVLMDFMYLPIRWDEELRQKINRESDFYRQNYCGCEFSIRRV